MWATVTRSVASGWRRRWRGGAAALLALAGLALVALAPAGLVMAWREHDEQRQRQSYHVGQPVPDGPITFVVHEVRCGADDDESVHGQRCEVTLGARNEGGDEVTVPDDGLLLHVAQGARLQPAPPTDPERGGLGTLEPRQAATAVIEYDLPVHATATHVEVRADTYSRGVAVAIGAPYPLLR